MGEWRDLPIKQLGRVITGATPKSSEPDSWGDEIDFITPTDQREGFREARAARRLSSVGAERLSSRIVPAGSTCFTCIGATIGKTSLTTRPAVTNQQINSVIPNPASTDCEFLYYLLTYHAADIARIASGSATPIVNKSQFENFVVRVPSVATQKAIGRILGALDDKIAVNERIAGVAEQLAAALASHTMWDTTTPLREIVDQTRDQVIPESINAKLIAHYSLPSFDASRLPETVEPWRIKSGKFQVVGAAVLLSKLNPSIPRVWNVDPSPSMPALASTEFLVLKPKAGITTHEVWAVCSQPEFFEELVGKATGISNSHQRVRPADILSTEVVDPRSMTDVVRGQIASLSRKAMRVRVESQVLAQLRDTLLPKLMSGELRVRDAEKAVEESARLEKVVREQLERIDG